MGKKEQEGREPDVSGLIERCKRGDLDAFNELITLYRVKAYGLAYSFLKNHHDAEDVSQEAFIKVFKSLSSYDSSGSFHSWLFTIVANLARNRIRWRNLRERLGFSLDEDHSQTNGNGPAPAQIADPDPASDPLAAVSRAWESKRISEAMDGLSDQQQVAIYLKFIHGYKISEIADLMCLAQGTVKTHISRGLEALRKVLEEENKSHAM